MIVSDRLGVPEDFSIKWAVLLSEVCDAHLDQIKTCELIRRISVGEIFNIANSRVNYF